ncbi:MAG TPA: PQQ-binding-like beta-propeller repeat protein, partial [Stellaceae bacterium]|nr:PQQ-binding-like beta-propeller repeat protein [Stellaceae bacterium]
MGPERATRGVLPLALAWLALVAPASGDETSGIDGGALYRERCAECHEGGVARAPGVAALRRLSADAIKAALAGGSMSIQGEKLTPAQREAVSRFLAGPAAAAEATPAQGQCAEAEQAPVDLAAGPHWNGWGVDAAQHRFQPADMAKLSAEDLPRLKLKWSFGFGSVSRASAQPTVMGGRLFVGSLTGKVYSLDAKSGCLEWTFEAMGPVRTAVSIGKSANGWAAYFGDQRANAYAVDALTGNLLWRSHVDEHRVARITGAPTLADGVLYVPVTSAEEVAGADPQYPCCSFRGSVVALDAASGKTLWKAYTIPEEPKPVRKNERDVQLWGPSGAGVWSSPTIDPDKAMVYVTTGDSYSDPPAATSDAFVAFHRENGALAWSRQMTEGDAFTVACSRAAAGTNNCPKAGGP